MDMLSRIEPLSDGYEVRFGWNMPHDMTWWHLAGYTKDENVALEAAKLLEISDGKSKQVFDMLDRE